MKKYDQLILMVLMISFLSTNLVFAGEVKDLLNVSLEDVINMALETSEDLEIQNNAVQREASKIKEERAGLLPSFSGEIEWSNNFKYPDIDATAKTKDYHVNVGITVSQNVFTFGRISNAIAAAQRALDASRFNQEGTKQGVIYDAKMAFYGTCLAQRTLDIAEESYKNALENKKILEERVSGGRVSKYDNIKISADIASRKPSVNNARASFISAMEALKTLIGLESKNSVDLSDSVNPIYPDFERDKLAFALYQNQPAIKVLAKNIEQKELLVRSKKAYLFPSVSTFATWNHKGDSNDVNMGSDSLDDYAVAGLKVNIPIWYGGISRAKLKQAKIDKKDADLLFQQGKETYLLLLDKTLNEYNEYKKTLVANNEAVRLAEESFSYSQEVFTSGQISITDLNDAELQLTNSKINREVTYFNLNKTLAILERITLMEKNNEE